MWFQQPEKKKEEPAKQHINVKQRSGITFKVMRKWIFSHQENEADKPAKKQRADWDEQQGNQEPVQEPTIHTSSGSARTAAVAATTPRQTQDLGAPPTTTPMEITFTTDTINVREIGTSAHTTAQSPERATAQENTQTHERATAHEDNTHTSATLTQRETATPTTHTHHPPQFVLRATAAQNILHMRASAVTQHARETGQHLTRETAISQPQNMRVTAGHHARGTVLHNMRATASHTSETASLRYNETQTGRETAPHNGRETANSHVRETAPHNGRETANSHVRETAHQHLRGTATTQSTHDRRDTATPHTTISHSMRETAATPSHIRPNTTELERESGHHSPMETKANETEPSYTIMEQAPSTNPQAQRHAERTNTKKRSRGQGNKARKVEKRKHLQPGYSQDQAPTITPATHMLRIEMKHASPTLPIPTNSNAQRGTDRLLRIEPRPLGPPPRANFPSPGGREHEPADITHPRSYTHNGSTVTAPTASLLSEGFDYSREAQAERANASKLQAMRDDAHLERERAQKRQEDLAPSTELPPGETKDAVGGRKHQGKPIPPNDELPESFYQHVSAEMLMYRRSVLPSFLKQGVEALAPATALWLLKRFATSQAMLQLKSKQVIEWLTTHLLHDFSPHACVLACSGQLDAGHWATPQGNSPAKSMVLHNAWMTFLNEAQSRTKKVGTLTSRSDLLKEMQHSFDCLWIKLHLTNWDLAPKSPFQQERLADKKNASVAFWAEIVVPIKNMARWDTTATTPLCAEQGSSFFPFPLQANFNPWLECLKPTLEKMAPLLFAQLPKPIENWNTTHEQLANRFAKVIPYASAPPPLLLFFIIIIIIFFIIFLIIIIILVFVHCTLTARQRHTAPRRPLDSTTPPSRPAKSKAKNKPRPPTTQTQPHSQQQKPLSDTDDNTYNPTHKPEAAGIAGAAIPPPPHGGQGQGRQECQRQLRPSVGHENLRPRRRRTDNPMR